VSFARTSGCAILSAAALLLQAGPTTATPPTILAYGIRAGLSRGPDQVTAGGFARLGPVGQKGWPAKFHLRPGLDAGVGDGAFSMTATADFIHPVDAPSLAVLPHLGVGLTLDHSRWKDSGTRTGLGVSILGGLGVDLAPFKRGTVEARVGLGRITDLRLSVGVSFS
jgi:hypothetical protein